MKQHHRMSQAWFESLELIGGSRYNYLRALNACWQDRGLPPRAVDARRTAPVVPVPPVVYNPGTVGALVEDYLVYRRGHRFSLTTRYSRRRCVGWW